MPLVPNALERLLLFRLNRGPGVAVDLFAAAGFRTVAYALDLGLFDLLRGGPRSAAWLARETATGERGIEAVAGLLVALGYLRERDGRYANAAATTRWLTDAEGSNLGPWFTMWDAVVFPYWDAVFAAAVGEGHPPETLYDYLGDDEAAWRLVQSGFRATAVVAAPEVLDAVPVPRGARVLDLGGGHGHYALELARRDPDLRATVFDLPAALDVARETVDAGGFAGRMDLVGGDYRRDDLGDLVPDDDRYDAVFLFNVVHAHDAAETRDLFERARAVLAPGGVLVVLDQFEGGVPELRNPLTGEDLPLSNVAAAGVAFVDLTYLVTLGARVHAVDAVERWLRGAGFASVERTTLRRSPGATVLVARVS
ncbi:methyltransferase [Halobium salinum]|uniref:Methyltransferase n=1 Tax=Halobium salinum TaxID=1364940 RepID=A0ABD5PEV9_9EURY|nr:class I SAM-dependent methyltransferase [Halobium salinum]